MKTRLYRRIVKKVCKLLKISRQQLFSRDFNEYVLICHKYNMQTKELEGNDNRLLIFSRQCPLSQVWKSGDYTKRFLLKYWQHSHWKQFINMRLDLGEKLDSILKSIIEKKNV